MTALLILIPVSTFLGLLGLAAFFWALKSDQYRDLEGDAARILFNEEEPDPAETPESPETPARDD